MIYSNILRKEIRLKLSSPMKNKNIAILQEASIPKIIFAKEKQIAFLQTGIIQASVEEERVIQTLQQKFQTIKKLFEEYVYANIPNAFWDIKQHVVELPYGKHFNERNILKMARPIQMNKELLEFCVKEIQYLLDKRLIRFSKFS